MELIFSNGISSNHYCLKPESGTLIPSASGLRIVLYTAERSSYLHPLWYFELHSLGMRLEWKRE